MLAQLMQRDALSLPLCFVKQRKCMAPDTIKHALVIWCAKLPVPYKVACALQGSGKQAADESRDLLRTAECQ